MSYQPLQCAGSIPEEFRSITAEKVQKAQAKERQSNRTRQEKSRVNEFLLRNNYVIDEMLNSGKVLFGDSLTLYVNSVADILLNDNKELRNTLRFYVVKSSDVNAFTTNMGIIFVTVGLLAQIETEAQLAFVLAHEIAHFERDHSIASVLEAERVFNQTRNDHYNGNETRIRLLSSFSREKETEADSIGFFRFVRTGYAAHAAISMMDVLQFEATPFLYKGFKTDFVLPDSLTLPIDHPAIDFVPVPLDEDKENDEISSHPNIFKRRERLWHFSQINPGGKWLFQAKQGEFESIQKLARLEVIHLELLEADYIKAFYEAQAMSQEYGPSQVFEELMGRALYGISQFMNAYQSSFLFPENQNAYADFAACSLFFNSLNPKQSLLIALHFNTQIYFKYKNDFTAKIIDDVIDDLIQKHSVDFQAIFNGINSADSLIMECHSILVDNQNPYLFKFTNASPDSTLRLPIIHQVDSKYESIRKLYVLEEGPIQDSIQIQRRNAVYEEWSELFPFYGFHNINLDDLKLTFQRVIVKSRIAAAEREEQELMIASNRSRLKRKGFEWGIDKIVFVDPYFMILDQRNGLKLIDSEKQLFDFNNQIKYCADKIKLQSDILFSQSMKEDESYRYNCMALLNDWVGEKIYLENLVEGMIPLQTEWTAAIADTFGTDFFCYTGVYTAKMKRTMRLFPVLLSALIYPLLPLAIIRAFTPVRMTYFYYMLYDMRNGSEKWILEKQFKRSASDGYINSILYDAIYQSKRKSPEK